jgi:ParB/RepB/Spo0J family partition protein
MDNILVEQVPIEDLGKTWGPRPSERMVEHVKRHGVLVPVLATKSPDEDGVLAWRIIDGNRRVFAAREAGLPTIPVAVMTGLEDVEIAELTLAANTLRTSNPVTEWWAIDDLLQKGHREQDVSHRTGLTPAALKARAKYGALDPRIFSGLVYGNIAPTVVEKASRLPMDAQDRIGDLYERTGALQTYQVELEAKKYRQPRAAAVPQSAAELTVQLDALASAAIPLEFTREAWLAAAAESFEREIKAEATTEQDPDDDSTQE